MSFRSLVLLAVAVPAFAFAAGPKGGALDTPAGVVDGATARALVEAGAVLVDVRTPKEFGEAHAPGAKNIPYDEIAQRAAEIGGPDTPVVLYCRSGRRSAIAAEALKELGYRKVWDLQTLDRWREKGQ